MISAKIDIRGDLSGSDRAKIDIFVGIPKGFEEGKCVWILVPTMYGQFTINCKWQGDSY